jgi:hypothetical protein
MPQAQPTPLRLTLPLLPQPHILHQHTVPQPTHTLQWLQWLQLGVTFSQVVWLIGC